MYSNKGVQELFRKNRWHILLNFDITANAMDEIFLNETKRVDNSSFKSRKPPNRINIHTHRIETFFQLSIEYE